MPGIVFPPSSSPGLRQQEAGGRLINAFAEKAPVGAPSQIFHRRSPGLERVALEDVVHTRGFLDIGNEAIWIVDEQALKFDAAYTVTALGALAGTESVTTARNNAGTPNNVVVTENGCFNLLSSGAPTAFADVDLPGSPTSVCDYNGYFIWSFGDGRIFASQLNSVDVSALSFTTEHGLNIRRVVRFSGRLYAFGNKWTAVYRDAGLSPFPLQREVTIPKGIAGTHAIAGWETGWANQLLWVGDDFVVYKLEGYTPTPIANDDVSRDIERAVLAGFRDSIDAFVYMLGKNAFWVVTCRDLWTWEYNLATGEWNERKSYNRESWKGSKTIRIFDNWFAGDGYTGELFKVNGTYYKEGTDPLVWHVESGVLADFPKGMVIPRASFNCTVGVGTYELVNDPKIEISWSLDGGYSWGDPVIRRLGEPGQTKSHPYILSSGLSKGQGVRYRLLVSDPVHVGLSGGIVEPEQRAYSG